MFKSSRMKNDVDPLHGAGKLLPVAHVAKEKASIFISGKTLLQEEKLAFVVVNPDQFSHPVFQNELTDQFGTHGAATASDQNALV